MFIEKYRGMCVNDYHYVYGNYIEDNYIYFGNGNTFVELEDFHEIEEGSLAKFTGKKDIDGNEIYSGDRFTFEYTKGLSEVYVLVGSFIYNEDDMRWEIDIDDNEYGYTCLSYVSNGVMENFKLLNC